MAENINKNIEQLEMIAHLHDESTRIQQQKITNQMSQNTEGLQALLKFLIKRAKNKSNQSLYLDGIILKSIYNCNIVEIQGQLNYYFQDGLVALQSDNGIDYKPLYLSLISNNLKEADRLTQRYFKELVQQNTSNKREWLYFTDIRNLPIKDLQTIDRLWTTYSIGKFGLSIQRSIWLYHNKNWEKFWSTIGWKTNDKILRYPHDFTWDDTAPTGHLPLFNQLRGVQVLTKLFMHPAWEINY